MAVQLSKYFQYGAAGLRYLATHTAGLLAVGAVFAQIAAGNIPGALTAIGAAVIAFTAANDPTKTGVDR